MLFLNFVTYLYFETLEYLIWGLEHCRKENVDLVHFLEIFEYFLSVVWWFGWHSARETKKETVAQPKILKHTQLQWRVF